MFSPTPRVIRFAKHLHVIQRPRWVLPEPIIVALITAFLVGSWAGYSLSSRDRCSEPVANSQGGNVANFPKTWGSP